MFSHMSVEPRDVPDNYQSREWFIEWARYDPTLKQLRDKRAEEFNTIIQTATNRGNLALLQAGNGRADTAGGVGCGVQAGEGTRGCSAVGRSRPPRPIRTRVTLAMLGLKHFKANRDTHSHGAGNYAPE